MRGRGIEDHEGGLGCELNNPSRRSDCAQIEDARPTRHQNQIGGLSGDHGSVGAMRGCIDNSQRRTGLPGRLKGLGDPAGLQRRNARRLALAAVGPCCRGRLRIDVQNCDAVASALGGHGKMQGNRGFSEPPLPDRTATVFIVRPCPFKPASRLSMANMNCKLRRLANVGLLAADARVERVRGRRPKGEAGVDIPALQRWTANCVKYSWRACRRQS